MNILVVDNYDSFTYNVVQYLGELKATVRVYRNDEITLPEIDKGKYDAIVLSPGPCTPNEAGICLELVRDVRDTPILGICLGHQVVAQAYGGNIVRAEQVMHGKTSDVYHDGCGVFAELPNPVTVARYHSLVAERESLPEGLKVSAWTQAEDGSVHEIMGLRHPDHPVEAVQFHPESIATEEGHQMLQNFLNGVGARQS